MKSHLERQLNVMHLGRIDYRDAWDMQRELVSARAEDHIPDTLLLLEHPHTYTFGRSGRREHLLISEAECTRQGVALYDVDRGGDVTYHGPGQLVGYPLLQLEPLKPDKSPPESTDSENSSERPVRFEVDYVGYVRKLEKTLILALANLGLVTGQRKGLTGVWVQADVWSRCPRCRPEDRQKPAKIAAIGVKVDARGVSRHGFALNVNPDMSYWDGIIACGLSDYPVASLADLLDPFPAMEQAKQEVVFAFGEVFGYEIK